MEFQTIANFLDTSPNEKKGSKFMINQKEIPTLTKKLELKLQC